MFTKGARETCSEPPSPLIGSSGSSCESEPFIGRSDECAGDDMKSQLCQDFHKHFPRINIRPYARGKGLSGPLSLGLLRYLNRRNHSGTKTVKNLKPERGGNLIEKC